MDYDELTEKRIINNAISSIILLRLFSKDDRWPAGCCQSEKYGKPREN